MRDRLPSAFYKALSPSSWRLKDGELHKAVLSLIRAYNFNFEMAFPRINVLPILWQYTQELCLPGRRPVWTC